MSGPTLCGELTEWVGDGSLLNCCVEDHNEPFADDFETRMREAAEGAWVDPREGYLSNEEVHEHFGFRFTDEDGHPEPVDDGDTEQVPLSTTMSLQHPYLRHLAQVYPGEHRDFMASMLSGMQEPDERCAAGSCTRLPLRRSTRYSRH